MRACVYVRIHEIHLVDGMPSSSPSSLDGPGATRSHVSSLHCSRGMSCSVCSLPITPQKIAKLQFGPTNAALKSGALELRSAYSIHRTLTPTYLSDCCNDASPSFTEQPSWKISAITMGLWFAFTITLYVLFFALRRKQLVKIRDIRLVTLFVLSLSLLVIFLNLSWIMGGSMPKAAEILAVAVTLYLYFHLMRAVRVLFIYKWHEAKASVVSSELVWFTKFQFVLGWRFYVGGVTVVLLVVVLPLVLSATLLSPVLVGPGSAVYSTIRCEWWEIPTEYTVATSNSTMCPCIRAQFFGEGEVSSTCEHAFGVTCFGSGKLSTLESQLCGECTTSPASEACSSAFIDLYASGNCGFPSHTPFFASCVAGPLADRNIAFAFAAVHYFIMGLNLLVIAPLVFKRDYFGMILENLLNILNSSPALSLVLLFFCYPTLITWKPFGYPAYYFLANLTLWLETLVSLGFPVGLYYWRKVRARCELKADVSANTVETPSESFTYSSMAAIHNINDKHAIDLQECICAGQLRSIYIKFCIDEFTTENVHFLDECMQLLTCLEETPKSGNSLADALQPICDKFIAVGSDFEVNLPSTVRNRLFEQLAAVRASSITGSAPPDTSLVDALRVVFVEILLLMSRSSWPRFIESKYYKEYSMVKRNMLRMKNLDMDVRKLLFADVDVEAPAPAPASSDTTAPAPVA